MDTNILTTYIKIEKEIEKLEEMRKHARQVIEAKYPNGYKDENINIHFKEVSKYEYSKDLTDLEKQQKITIKHLKELEEETNKAIKTTTKVLTITVK